MSKNFTTLTATYRIVTPMFCAGADQQTAELRLPSFKGALRFWWRSLMWGKVQSVAELHRKEAELFGSSDQKIGQSKVRMRLTSNQVEKPAKSANWTNMKGIQYLGYGVLNFRGELSRPMIPSGTFTVQLRLGPGISDEQQQQIENALILLGTVGGLGSKSRKGFGSLTLKTLKQDDHDVELKADPIERIKSALGVLQDGEPEWTAWSKKSRILAASSNNSTAVELHDLLGREQVFFRSWGSDNRGKLPEHRTLEKPSEQNFPDDHHLSKPSLRNTVAINHPRRVAFGLPHNYQTGGVKPSTHDRRASPLFLHVHQANEHEPPVGVVAFLPSLFLPDGEQIQAFNKTVPLDTSDRFWSPIHAYLDRLKSKGERPENRAGYEAFPEDSEWWKKKQTDLQAEEVTLG